MMRIRVAEWADCADLAALDARCRPVAWSYAQFQAACASPHDTVLVAENADGLQGLVVWQRLFDEMELHLLATAPEFRRCGIARQLLSHLFQAATQYQVYRILLEVSASNVPAQALYVQCGFVEIAKRPHYYGTEDALIMEKIC